MLCILDQGHIVVDNMSGSWAGAMGQCQFMPSSFRKFAQDFNNDGKQDIWTTLSDVFASAANYLAMSGWNHDQTWGREVIVPKSIDKKLLKLDIQKSLQQWQDLGVRRLNRSALPKTNLQASIIQPDGPSGKSYLVYENFRVLLKWNRSFSFAIAVGRLSDKIAAN
jgi:membrane-bound lytic murein transglycosylase B